MSDGPSDGPDFLNAAEIARSCRTDGVLLRADSSLATLDAALRLGFDAPEGRGLFLWGSHTQIGELRWVYLVSVSTPSDVTLHLEVDLHATAGVSYVLLDVWASRLSYISPDTSASPADSPSGGGGGGGFLVPQSPAAAVPGHSDGGTYQILAPVLPRSGWCLLGEANKTVAVSRRRFGAVIETGTGTAALSPRAAVAEVAVAASATVGDAAGGGAASGGFHVSIRAASEERVVVWVLPPKALAALAADGEGSAHPLHGTGGGDGVIEVVCEAGACTGEDCDVEMLLECGGGSEGEEQPQQEEEEQASCACKPALSDQ
jgi:hypothetical protein